MKKFFLFMLFISLLFAKDIKVASYNVENLFDGFDNGNEYKDFKIAHKTWSKKAAEIKFNQTLKAIKYINADIIALQEVENKELLKRIAYELDYKHFAFSKPFMSPVGVGILSKYPIISKKSINAGIQRTRDFLQVGLNVESEKLFLWIVHFPTQKYQKSERLKVAKTLKNAVLKAKEKKFLLLGDFNTKIKPNSILRQVFGELGDKKDFYDPWQELPFEQRYSQSFYGKKSALDRIIIGEALINSKALRYKDGSFEVIKGILSDKKGNPNRWKSKTYRGFSDHFPIMITLTNDKKDAKNLTTKSIEKLYNLDKISEGIKLKNVVVTYKKGHGLILSQKDRGIYVYKPMVDLKIGHKYDILVKSFKDYKGVREITSFEVLDEHGRVKDLNEYYLPLRKINNAQIGDVFKNIEGKYKNQYLFTKHGKIRLYHKDKRKLKDGEILHFDEVRVGMYRGKTELIMEE